MFGALYLRFLCENKRAKVHYGENKAETRPNSQIREAARIGKSYDRRQCEQDYPRNGAALFLAFPRDYHYYSASYHKQRNQNSRASADFSRFRKRI